MTNFVKGSNIIFHRLPKQLHQASSCSVAGKMQSLSTTDIPASLLNKIKQLAPAQEDERNLTLIMKKAFRVVRHGEFYFSEKYSKCKKRNGYTVVYHKPGVQEDFFGQIQYFVVIESSLDVIAIIQPFTRDLVHEAFHHLIPINIVAR